MITPSTQINHVYTLIDPGNARLRSSDQDAIKWLLSTANRLRRERDNARRELAEARRAAEIREQVLKRAVGDLSAVMRGR